MKMMMLMMKAKIILSLSYQYYVDDESDDGIISAVYFDTLMNITENYVDESSMMMMMKAMMPI